MDNAKYKVKILEHGIVAARPDQMYGWPGIIRVKEKEIVVSASERKYHVCPFGREVVIRSLDNGKTWQLPQEVYNSELDDRDGNLAILPDGTIVLTWFTSDEFKIEEYGRPEWQARANRVTQKMRDELIGTWLLRSFDGGYTWEETPHHFTNGFGSGAHAGPTVLSDGTLIYLGEIKGDAEHEMTAFVSSDAGISWKRTGIIPSPKVKDYKGNIVPIINENHVLELSPEKLIALFRAEHSGEGYLHQSNSEDNGKTWSPVKRLPVWGYPPHLLRLHSGAVLCSYGHRREPWSIRAVLSYNDGQIWDIENIITLYTWEDKPDMGYPVSLEVAPGEILTVYYCARKPRKWVADHEKLDKKGATPEGILYTRFILSQ